MNYTDILLAYCESTKCKLYLELGCQHATTIRKMLSSKRRVIGVDIKQQFDFSQGFFEFHQETTDKFFEHFNESPDIIFIDADHNINSVIKDLNNSLRVLNEGGTIFIHDSDPEEEKLLQPQYCEDSYKIVEWIRENRPELDVMVIPADEPGMVIVRRKNDRRVLKFL